ncbi:MAG: shikimate dehydrogenase [Pseudomonadales bacterium]|nr:shikimate dehydrogenase [Pseudomonadales bacterium]
MPTTRYALFGNPVAHSLSPRIHTLFAGQTDEPVVYSKKKVEEARFEQEVRDFFSAGGGGLNITQPHKQLAANIADHRSQAVELAGAANTLFLKDGQLYAENTDGAGLVSDLLLNLGWQIEGQRILLLGAGGAVRGVLEPLLACRPEKIAIANRTVAKAQQLVEQFEARATLHKAVLEASTLEAAACGYDIVINASSAGLSGAIPAIDKAVVDGARCYDMVYGEGAAPFLQWAAQSGARSVADGLGMLVEQAAVAFYIWRGVHPRAREVIAQLRGEA